MTTETKVIPRPEAVQAEIDQFQEQLKRLRRLLKVSEETYGELPQDDKKDEKTATE